MSVPSPVELLERYGGDSPETLATLLGFQVMRLASPPAAPGITILSEYRVEARAIMLYEDGLRQLADQRDQPFARFAQWHIAHELYHGLAEAGAISAWRIRETEADLWADELMAVMRPEGYAAR